MKQSELKSRIDTIDRLIESYEDELYALKGHCTHTFDDGTSAMEAYGNAEQSWEECSICGRVIYYYEFTD